MEKRGLQGADLAETPEYAAEDWGETGMGGHADLSGAHTETTEDTPEDTPA